MFGFGVSAMWGFARWIYPTIPKSLAWPGLAVGISAVALFLFPALRFASAEQGQGLQARRKQEPYGGLSGLHPGGQATPSRDPRMASRLITQATSG
jgi:hypothetical protein